jgi:hypothetical protein
MRTPTLVIATILASTTAAGAEQVGVVVTGEATVQPQIYAQLEGWLHEKGRTVVPGPLAPEAINTLIDCFVLEDLGCARGVVDARSKSKAVVFARAETQPNGDGTRDVAITGYWFQKNRDVLSERRVCKRCNDEVLHATVDELMLALVHDPPPPAPTASPANDTELERIDTDEGGAGRWLPLAMIGVGTTALVAGGFMIAIDQDADPVGKQAPRFRDTATGGVVLAITGAAVLGAGIYMHLRNKRSAPVAALSSDGAYIGWAGRF